MVRKRIPLQIQFAVRLLVQYLYKDTVSNELVVCYETKNPLVSNFHKMGLFSYRVFHVNVDSKIENGQKSTGQISSRQTCFKVMLSHVRLSYRAIIQ